MAAIKDTIQYGSSRLSELKISWGGVVAGKKQLMETRFGITQARIPQEDISVGAWRMEGMNSFIITATPLPTLSSLLSFQKNMCPASYIWVWFSLPCPHVPVIAMPSRDAVLTRSWRSCMRDLVICEALKWWKQDLEWGQWLEILLLGNSLEEGQVFPSLSPEC